MVNDELAIMSINCNFHARKLAQKVFKDPSCFYMAWSHYDARIVDKRIPYIIGFYSNSRKTLRCHYDMIGLDPRSSVLYQPPAIIHWVGTDIVNAVENFMDGEKRMFEKLSDPNIVHLVHLEEHLIEMKEVMPHANYRIIPLPPYAFFEPEPYPDGIPVVSVYMPTLRQEFYRSETIVQAAMKFPEVRFEFYYYYDKRKEEEPIRGTVNCFRVPSRDEEGMKEQIRKSRAFIRIPVHDGLSVQALEFASAGRSVIYNKNLPFVDFCETDGKLESDVPRLASLIQKVLDRTEPNFEMSKHYREEFSHEKYLAKITEVVEEVRNYEPKELVHAS